MFAIVLVFSVFFNVKDALAWSNCICSATGDPHIRNFDGATSTVGPGQYTLIADTQNKFKIEMRVAQTTPKLSQITEVSVELSGDVVEDLPDYGQIHRAGGLEVRVLKTNNVFIIWDSSKEDTQIMTDSLCGTQCPNGEYLWYQNRPKIKFAIAFERYLIEKLT